MSRPTATHDDPEPPSPKPPSPSLADITYRVMTGFSGVVDRSTILRVVGTCHRDLRAAPGVGGSDGATLSERIERRARNSLAALIESGSARLPSR